MKKTTLLAVAFIFIVQCGFAGGILTNANQSAQYIRMLSRNASTELDAVYFNPAGLVLLDDGIFVGIHNQTIFQERTITSEFPLLNDPVYKGDVKAPFFPTAFAAYKKNDWVLSFGFGPNGGGGTAEFDRGIPTFEKGLSLLPLGLAMVGVPATAYSADLYLDGWSVFWGLQLNASYKVSDVFSTSLGVRYVDAVNKYNGYIEDISVEIGGTYTLASELFAGMAATATAASQAFSQYPAEMAMPDETADNAGLPRGTTFGQAVSTMNDVAASANQKALGTADVQTDTKQTGRGFTPIIGANISLDRLNIGMKYEFKTKLLLTNDTKVDGTGFFPDGREQASDIPAILSIGADYMLTSKFKTSISFNNYFDKAVDWNPNVYGEEKTFDHNLFEVSIGLEYAINDDFKVSVGGMHSNTGVTEQYLSDFSFSNSSYSGAFGFQYKISDRLLLDAGVLYTAYVDQKKSFVDSNIGNYTETYDKMNLDFAFGVAYKLF